MKQFKEFRMPPITMGRDNTIVGVRDHDIPGSKAQTEMLKKAKAKMKKKISIKLPKFKMKTPAALKKIAEDEPRENKMAFLKRVKERFPKIAKSRPTMDRIVQIVKPKNQINSKRYVELGKLYDSGNMKKLNDLITKFEKEDGIREGKITWQRGLVSDGTMKIGIFDGDKEKALEAARQLIIFLRKNKRVKIGGDKEDTDGEPNEAIAKYSEELSKLIFDDELLDSLEPDGNNADQTANDIVLNRLRDLGVNIR